MDKTEAAKMLVVAWVKGWGMRTLAVTLCGPDWTAEEIHARYPWMTKITYLYLAHKGRGVDVRRYVADYLPALNQKIWDCKDNTERLALAALVLRSRCVTGIVRSQEGKDAARERKEYRRSMLGASLIGAAKNASQRGAWNVCK